MKKFLTLAAGALIGLSASLPAEAALVTRYTAGTAIENQSQLTTGKYFIYAYSKGVGRFIHPSGDFISAKGLTEIPSDGITDGTYVYTITVNDGTFNITTGTGLTFPINGDGGQGKGNIRPAQATASDAVAAEFVLSDLEVAGQGEFTDPLFFVTPSNATFEGNGTPIYLCTNGGAADGSDHHLGYWTGTGSVSESHHTALAFYPVTETETLSFSVEAGHYYFLKNSELGEYLQLESATTGTLAGVSSEIKTPLIITEGTGDNAGKFAIQSASTGKYFASDALWNSIYNSNSAYYWNISMIDDTRFTLAMTGDASKLAGPQGSTDKSIWTDNWIDRIQNGNPAHVYWELEEAPTYTVTYNYTQNGVTFSRTATLAEWTNAGTKVPTNSLFLANTGVAETDKYVKADNATFTVTGDWNYPVQANTVYRIGNKPSENGAHVVVTNADGTSITNDNEAGLTKDNMWYFKSAGHDAATGNPIFTMHSLIDDTKGVTFEDNDSGHTSTLTTAPDQLTLFPVTVSTASTDFCLQYTDASNNTYFVNDRGVNFSSWRTSLGVAVMDEGCVVRALSLTEEEMNWLNLVATDEERGNPTPANVAAWIDRYYQISPEFIQAIAAAEEYEAFLGTGLGRYNNADGDFADKLADARALLNNPDATEDQKTAAIAAIAVSTLHINQPVPGHFYRFHYGNSYLTSKVNNNNRFIIEEQSDPDANSVFYYDAYTDNGTNKSHLVTYPGGLVMGNLDTNSTAEANGSLCGVNKGSTYAGNTIEFFGSAYVKGKYNIKVNGDHYLYHTDSNVDSGKYSGNLTDSRAGYQWEITEVTWLPIPVDVNKKHFSVCVPVDLNIDANRAEAHTGVIQGSNFGLQAIERTLPANTPAVLEYKGGAAHNCVYFEIAGYPEIAAAAETTNDLTNTGVYATAKEAGQSYFTVDHESFVPHAEDTLPAFAAVLKVPTEQANPDGYAIAEYNPDYVSITEIESAGNNGKQVIYDLQGRRVQRASKGLYIINGVKTLVK